MGRLALAENLAVVEIPNLDLVGSTPLKAPQKSQNVTAELALAGDEVKSRGFRGARTPWGIHWVTLPWGILGARVPLAVLLEWLPMGIAFPL